MDNNLDELASLSNLTFGNGLFRSGDNVDFVGGAIDGNLGTTDLWFNRFGEITFWAEESIELLASPNNNLNPRELYFNTAPSPSAGANEIKFLTQKLGVIAGGVVFEKEGSGTGTGIFDVVGFNKAQFSMPTFIDSTLTVGTLTPLSSTFGLKSTVVANTFLIQDASNREVVKVLRDSVVDNPSFWGGVHSFGNPNVKLGNLSGASNKTIDVGNNLNSGQISLNFIHDTSAGFTLVSNRTTGTTMNGGTSNNGLFVIDSTGGGGAGRRIGFNINNTQKLKVTERGFEFFQTSNAQYVAGTDYGNGFGILTLANAGSAPTSNPSNKVYLWCENIAPLGTRLRIRNSNGTIINLVGDTGWTLPTGTASKTGFNADSLVTASAAYTQTEVQQIANELRETRRGLKAVIDTLFNVHQFFRT